MITPQSQVKVNLPLPLKEFLESRANRFGMPISVYVKHLILKDVESMEYPTYQASRLTIERAKEALKNDSESVAVDNIDEFFEKL